MQREFTSVIEKKGNWYIGYAEELPGVNIQGENFERSEGKPQGSSMLDYQS